MEAARAIAADRVRRMPLVRTSPEQRTSPATLSGVAALSGWASKASAAADKVKAKATEAKQNLETVAVKAKGVQIAVDKQALHDKLQRAGSLVADGAAQAGSAIQEGSCIVAERAKTVDLRDSARAVASHVANGAASAHTALQGRISSELHAEEVAAPLDDCSPEKRSAAWLLKSPVETPSPAETRSSGLTPDSVELQSSPRSSPPTARFGQRTDFDTQQSQLARSRNSSAELFTNEACALLTASPPASVHSDPRHRSAREGSEPAALDARLDIDLRSTPSPTPKPFSQELLARTPEASSEGGSLRAKLWPASDCNQSSPGPLENSRPPALVNGDAFSGAANCPRADSGSPVSPPAFDAYAEYLALESDSEGGQALRQRPTEQSPRSMCSRASDTLWRAAVRCTKSCRKRTRHPPSS